MPGEDLPPLPGEDHRCERCGVWYPAVGVESALGVIARLPGDVREAASSLPAEDVRRRLAPDVWSVLEYACHVRDVYATYTIRLHRARTEELPAVEPMFNDLRARRFGYNELDLEAVLDELARNARGFRAEAGRLADGDWDRQVARLPEERRTARWLVRQAMHEGVHHLGDIRLIADRIGTR